MILMAAALHRMSRGIVGQKTKVRIPISVGCISGRPYWQKVGGEMFQAGSSWNPLHFHKKTECS